METSKSKTKILVCSRNEASKPDIKLNVETLEVLDKYKYLGSTITNDGVCTKETRCRLQQTRCLFKKKKG